MLIVPAGFASIGALKVGSPSSIRTSNPSVNSRGCETLNALFGVAYDRTTLNPDLQLGNFGQPNERRKALTPSDEKQAALKRSFRPYTH